MKQGSNRRPRTRGNPNNNKQRSGGRNSYDSNGPAGKVRGTAQQVLDKYQALGRDAMTSGDRIAAESFFQFAEHYHRIVNADATNMATTQNNQNQNQKHERGERQEAGQPEVVVDVPVVDVNASPEAADKVADKESTDALAVPVFDVNETPEAPQEEAPKAPRRRRSRAKAEAAEA